MRMEPWLSSDPLFREFTPEQVGGYIMAGGMHAQVNYFFKPWNTIISARYEEMNLSDIVPGKSQRFSPFLAWQINGFNAMIKFQYFLILEEEEIIDPLRWREQFRIGMQFMLR